MLGEFTLANNVRVTLSASITNTATSITVNAATGQYNNPPNPSGDTASGGVGVATLVDVYANPTATEIVTYTSLTNNGNGTYTLGGVTRGVQGTTNLAWSSGATLIQAATAAQMSHQNVSYNKSTSTLGAPNLSLSGTLLASGVATFTVAPIFAALTGYIKGNGSSVATAASTVPATDLSGTLAAAQFPALTGDVTCTPGSLSTAIAAGAVGTSKIASGAVDSTRLASNSVQTAKIVDNAVTLAKLDLAPASSIMGNNGGGPANVQNLTVAQVKTLLAISTADVSGLNTMSGLTSLGTASVYRTNSGNFGGTFITDQSASGNYLSGLGFEYSSGGMVMTYGLTPSTSASGTFNSSYGGIALTRLALTLNGGGLSLYTAASQTVAANTGIAVTAKLTVDLSGNMSVAGALSTASRLTVSYANYTGLALNNSGGSNVYIGAGTGTTPSFYISNKSASIIAQFNDDLSMQMYGPMNFGSTYQQTLSLYSTTHGVGAQTSTSYVRTAGGFNVYKGGIHSNTQDDPGSGGTALLRVNSSGGALATAFGSSAYPNQGTSTTFDWNNGSSQYFTYSAAQTVTFSNMPTCADISVAVKNTSGSAINVTLPNGTSTLVYNIFAGSTTIVALRKVGSFWMTMQSYANQGYTYP